MPQVLERPNHPAPFDAVEIETVGLKAFGRAMETWKVRNADAAALLGVSGRTWSRAKTGEAVRLTADNLDRISAVVGIYKGLRLYFSDVLADRWVRLENAGPPFLGRTPLTYMIGGLPNLLSTRAYVDALRGGL